MKTFRNIFDKKLYINNTCSFNSFQLFQKGLYFDNFVKLAEAFFCQQIEMFYSTFLDCMYREFSKQFCEIKEPNRS